MLTAVDGDYRLYQYMAWGGLVAQAVLWVALSLATGMNVDPAATTRNFVLALGGLIFWGITLAGSRHGESLSDNMKWALPIGGQLAQVGIVINLLPVLNTVPCYMLATFGGALWDARLAAFDAMLGIHVPTIVAWVKANPMADEIFNLAYGSMFLQFGMVGAAVAITRNLRTGWEMAAIVLWGTFFGLFVFALVPADGPFSYFGLDASPVQAGFVDYCHRLRAGGVTVFDEGHGIITFPSFHVFFALSATWGARRFKPLLAVLLLLNVVNIAATMTTGWHYFADVLGGVALFGTIAVAVHYTEKFISRHRPAAPRPTKSIG